MNVYLAGPEVFMPNAPDIFAQKKSICSAYSCVGLAPFDNEIELNGALPHQAAEMIYHENIRLIDLCDAVVANITPFRGPHMDPGTAFEIGYAVAKGKPLACYTQEGRILIDRISSYEKNSKHPPKDSHGYFIENFDLNENLMIKISLNFQKRKLVVHHLPLPRRFTTAGFEGALKQLLKPN